MKVSLAAATRFSLILFALLYLSLFFCQQIDLTNADLGQHLKSGQTILDLGRPLTTNYFSYTEPDYPFSILPVGVPYHWIWSLAGFVGLSLFNVSLNVLAITLFLLASNIRSRPVYPVFFFFLALPLMTVRTEVRPEFYSYAFLAIFYFILNRSASGRDARWLWVLPLIQILWVNLHHFYFFGPLLVLLYAILHRHRGIGWVFLAVVFACLVNYHFIRGAFSFSLLWKSCSLMPVENRGSWESGSIYDRYFQGATVFYLILVLAILAKGRAARHSVSILMGLLMAWIGWNHVRTYPLFGYFFMVSSADLFGDLAEASPTAVREKIGRWMAVVSGIILGISLLVPGHIFSPWKKAFGLGLRPGNERSAVFFRENGLKGPIFNNYDCGSFLIFELFPSERVFVDNRYLSYSDDFFAKIYKPMIVKDAEWERLSGVYGIRAIYFRYDDSNAPKNSFLMRRLHDPAWALVYADERIAILLKRDKQNAELIERLEIKPAGRPADFNRPVGSTPQEAFGT